MPTRAADHVAMRGPGQGMGVERMPSSPRKRGRPYRPPVDPTPYAAVTGGADARIAWLLGTTRLHAAEGRFANRRDFVPALAGAGISCDESRISRWESGSTHVPLSVIAGYEQVLELPQNRLTAVAQHLSPAPAIGNSRKELTPESHRRLDELVDLTLDGAPSGSDWLDLADILAEHPTVYMRADIWRDLTARLLAELCRSLGVGYVTRLVTLRTLLTHPVVQHHVVRAIGQFVMDPCSVRVADAVALLQHVPGAKGTPIVMRLLGSDSEPIRRGAARAAAAMLARDDFAPEHLPELETTLPWLLSLDEQATHAAEVVRQLPPASQERVRAAVRRPHHGLELVLKHAETVPPETARSLGTSLATEAQVHAGGPSAGEPDHLLQRLVREALFHAHPERRSQAATLLMASGFREGISRACGHLLGSDGGATGVPVARLLKYCFATRELPIVFGAAVGGVRGPTDGVRVHALHALGHLPQRLSVQQARLLAAGIGDAERRIVDATLYALGMHGRSDVVGQDSPAPRVRELHRWWSGAGERLLA